MELSNKSEIRMPIIKDKIIHQIEANEKSPVEGSCHDGQQIYKDEIYFTDKKSQTFQLSVLEAAKGRLPLREP
jgi:hypothetical protein